MEALQELARGVLVLALAAAAGLSAGCADHEPPRWPDGAELRATVQDATVRLSWPEATDDRAVTRYRVSRGRTHVGETTTRSFSVPRGRSAAASTSYEVVPLDEAGHAGRPLRTEVQRRRQASAVTVAEQSPERDVASLDEQDPQEGVAPHPDDPPPAQRLMEFIPGETQSGRPPVVEAERSRRGLAPRHRIGDRVHNVSRVNR